MKLFKYVASASVAAIAAGGLYAAPASAKEPSSVVGMPVGSEYSDGADYLVAAEPGVETLIQADSSDADVSKASDDAAAAAKSTAPTMSFGEWGVDTSLLSDEIKPGDDFFGYVNEEWLEANPLPDEFSRYGVFNMLREKSTSDVKSIIDDMVANRPAAGTDAARVVDVYSAFMDEDAINSAGLSPAYPFLTEVFEAGSLNDLAGVWAEPGAPSPVGGYVSVDSKQPDQYTVFVYSDGLGLPARDYYLDTSEKGKEIQQKYRDYLAFLAEKAGYSDPEATANAVYQFENRIARDVEWPRAISRNRDLRYTPTTRTELEAMADGFPVGAMLDKTGLAKSDKFVVTQVPPTPEKAKEVGMTTEQLAELGGGTPGMFALLSKTDMPTLQAWTALQFLSSNAAVLPKDIDDARFAFYGKTLAGQNEQRPRWKRAVDEVESELGELLGRQYVDRYFPAENKQEMQKLVANLRIALGQSIDQLDWMSEPTKKEAKAKLDSFDPKIGYSDNLETYQGLEVTETDPLGNRLSAAEWALKDNVDKLGKPIDRTEWEMFPQTVNAYYNPSKNEIVFPAGILQQPFFGLTADPAVNYGAIGAVIGHEMGHGFDDQGAKSDGTGLLRNWWQDEDLAAFKKRADAIVAQYNSYCPLDDGKTCVDGRLTLGENIGDIGGLNIAYRAYKLATEGQDVPVIDGLTGDQRFFLAWAQVWRSVQSEDNARQRLRADPHSPEEYRVNGVVRNLDAWYDAFGVKPGDALYLPPEQRVVIW